MELRQGPELETGMLGRLKTFDFEGQVTLERVEIDREELPRRLVVVARFVTEPSDGADFDD